MLVDPASFTSGSGKLFSSRTHRVPTYEGRVPNFRYRKPPNLNKVKRGQALRNFGISDEHLPGSYPQV
jgi:hypothetical protein